MTDQVNARARVHWLAYNSKKQPKNTGTRASTHTFTFWLSLQAQATSMFFVMKVRKCYVCAQIA